MSFNVILHVAIIYYIHIHILHVALHITSTLAFTIVFGISVTFLSFHLFDQKFAHLIFLFHKAK